MSWGELDRFPFLADVWGTAADWASGIGTAAAALIAVFVYWATKRQDRRAQASLVYVEVDGANITVHNLSDKQIADVKLTPRIMNLWRAAQAGEFDQMIIWGTPRIEPYPSYDFYERSKQIQREMRENIPRLEVCPSDRCIKAGQHVKELVGGMIAGGMVYYFVFRDARGLEWSINVNTKRLRMVKASRVGRISAWIRSTITGTWWVMKNEPRYLWKHRLYHPSGRPPE